MRSGREGGMAAIETPEIAAKASLRGLYPPKSRASKQNVLPAGEVAAITGGKTIAVEIVKTLCL